MELWKSLFLDCGQSCSGKSGKKLNQLKFDLACLVSTNKRKTRKQLGLNYVAWGPPLTHGMLRTAFEKESPDGLHVQLPGLNLGVLCRLGSGHSRISDSTVVDLPFTWHRHFGNRRSKIRFFFSSSLRRGFLITSSGRYRLSWASILLYVTYLTKHVSNRVINVSTQARGNNPSHSHGTSELAPARDEN